MASLTTFATGPYPLSAPAQATAIQGQVLVKGSVENIPPTAKASNAAVSALASAAVAAVVAAGSRRQSRRSSKLGRAVSTMSTGTITAEQTMPMSPGMTMPLEEAETPKEILAALSAGNQRYIAGHGNVSVGPLVDRMMEDPLKPVAKKAIVISCARSYIPVETLFDTEPGQLEAIAVCGIVCDPHDGISGSVEFSLATMKPQVLLVLGNTRNDVIETAVREAMIEAGRGSDAPPEARTAGTGDTSLTLYSKVAPSAKDALKQTPFADFESLCTLTMKLNVWKTMETMVTTSGYVNEEAKAGGLIVQGAILNVDTGRVQFLGAHPSYSFLLNQRVPTDVVRTAADPRVPAEEALTTLVMGNRRFQAGTGGQTNVTDEDVLVKLTEGGQNPIASVVGCADSRAPVELLFDLRPGDLFVLRNAGNTVASGLGSLVGSLEYSIAVLGTQCVVVTGHTKCGAVTAAVEAVLQDKELESYPGSIGNVLRNIVDMAKEAVKQMPDASLEEQVKLATRLNVYYTMEKLIQSSEIVRAGVISQKLQLHGSIYDIFTGSVEWLGEHPKLNEIVGEELQIRMWKQSPYVRAMPETFGRGAKASTALQRLGDGNARFVAGISDVRGGRRADSLIADPYCLVIGGADAPVSFEKIFDAAPGDIIQQRNLGNIVCGGGGSGCAFASVEYAVARWAPSVLLVLGDTACSSISAALRQVDSEGATVPSPGERAVLDRVLPSALRARKQVMEEPGITTAAGRSMKVMQLAVELNTLYTIETLLTFSSVIREAVSSGSLEIHAALFNRSTGVVEFIGEHPLQDELMTATLKA